jgi:hypothetical protein
MLSKMLPVNPEKLHWSVCCEDAVILNKYTKFNGQQCGVHTNLYFFQQAKKYASGAGFEPVSSVGKLVKSIGFRYYQIGLKKRHARFISLSC